MNLSTVALAAEAKFGSVLICAQTEDDVFKLAILRREPVFKEAPYMTITAYTMSSNSTARASHIAFEHGHYDLTAERVKSIASVWVAA